MQKTVIIIAGPTASGKTALALQLAAHFKTSIISADSRQCFRELSIGVAKPTEKELQQARHYFINSHSITEEVSAQAFEEYALKCVSEIFENNDVAIMAGGTGLYIKAFCEGLDEIPATDENIRKQIIDNYNKQGLQWLQHEVQQQDPQFWAVAEQQNPQRLMRALEVKLSTGKSIISFRTNKKNIRPFSIIKTAIDVPKEQLHENINRRIDEMMQAGLENEVKQLIKYKHLNALQTVGYSEMFEYLAGKTDLEKAVELIKVHTRQYAKRQMTWFKKDKEIFWINPLTEKDLLFQFIADRLRHE